MPACRRITSVCAVAIFFSAFSLHAAAGPVQKIASLHSTNDSALPPALLQEAKSEPWTDPERGPVPNLRIFGREPSGALWLGSDQGAVRFDPRSVDSWDRWQYFSGRRWLPDNSVQNICITNANSSSVAWIRTRTGAARIEFRPMTLEEKAQYFDERIEARHVRHGFVADSALGVAGDTSTSVNIDTDNDGLWTAIYLGAQSYRYAVTRDPDARRKARRALDAILRLEDITGVPGFYARSFKSKEEPAPHGGEWHPTPDGRWLWKGDTSSDESVGHYYAYAIYYDLVADRPEKAQIRKVVARMTDYLIEHDYDLLDLDGKPTRWGQWSERYFKTEEGSYEAALRSLQLLSFLKTTHHITGSGKYEQAYRDRIRRGYAEKMRWYRRWPGGGEINFSDDELAYLSYDPLLRYEKEMKLRGIYLDGLRYTWTQIRPDRNPLWNYISVAGGAGVMTGEVRDESRRALERIPMDMIEWEVRNSNRLDVTFRRNPDRFHRREIRETLAPDERPVSKWNGNPYIPDGGGNGQREDDGAYFLLPYWMGRYYHWVR